MDLHEVRVLLLEAMVAAGKDGNCRVRFPVEVLPHNHSYLEKIRERKVMEGEEGGINGKEGR